MSQLAEQHRDQLCPATEALGSSFRIVLLHQRREFKARQVLKQLIEQAHCLYHRSALLLGIRRTNSPVKRRFDAGTILGGLVSWPVSAQRSFLFRTRVQ